jgi:hypothetical protein
VGLKRGPLSLMSRIEELLERKSSGSGLESREYGRRDLARWKSGTLYQSKVCRMICRTRPTKPCVNIIFTNPVCKNCSEDAIKEVGLEISVEET